MGPWNDALATWLDDSVWRSGPEAWHALRTMRPSPPGAASGRARARADVFRSALEQAQQQITAARSVGYESRPLNLFYGLSQAGRAIGAVGLPASHPAAFQPPKDAVGPWELDSHGIDVVNLNDVVPSSFPRMVMIPKGKANSPGSFIRLAGLLNPGCKLPNGVTMRQLWACLPDAARLAPLTTGSPSVLTLHPWKLADVPYAFVGLLYMRDRPRQSPGEVSDRATQRFLSHYPTLVGYRLRIAGGKWPAAWSLDPHTLLSVLGNVSWPMASPSLTAPLEAERAVGALTTDYRGRAVVLPKISSADTEPLHPLLTWWAILFGLSMLCRYRPVVWTKLIDINHSDYASAIEHLLDVGLDAVPDLIERTIRQVAN